MEADFPQNSCTQAVRAPFVIPAENLQREAN
jgi:hypothetical protein